MYLSISHSFLDCFAWNMDQIQAISHVHTAAWPNDQSQPVITGYWPVIENFHNWKNRTDNFQKRQKPDRWSGHKSVQFGPVSVFFPALRLDFKTLKPSICTNKQRNSRTNDRNPSLLGTSRNRQNIGTDDMRLLVARNEERHPKICSKLQHLSNSQTRLTSKGSPSSPEWDTWRSLAGDLSRHDGPIAGIERVRHHSSGSRSIHKEIVLPSHQFNSYIQWNSDTVLR